MCTRAHKRDMNTHQIKQRLWKEQGVSAKNTQVVMHWVLCFAHDHDLSRPTLAALSKGTQSDEFWDTVEMMLDFLKRHNVPPV